MKFMLIYSLSYSNYGIIRSVVRTGELPLDDNIGGFKFNIELVFHVQTIKVR